MTVNNPGITPQKGIFYQLLTFGFWSFFNIFTRPKNNSLSN